MNEGMKHQDLVEKGLPKKGISRNQSEEEKVVREKRMKEENDVQTSSRWRWEVLMILVKTLSSPKPWLRVSRKIEKQIKSTFSGAWDADDGKKGNVSTYSCLRTVWLHQEIIILELQTVLKLDQRWSQPNEQDIRRKLNSQKEFSGYLLQFAEEQDNTSCLSLQWVTRKVLPCIDVRLEHLLRDRHSGSMVLHSKIQNVYFFPHVRDTKKEINYIVHH